MIDRSVFKESLESQLRALGERGFDVRPLVFAPPATEVEVRALENELGRTVPPSFRRVLTQISSHVEFRWFAPRDLRFLPPFQSNFSGDLHWSLKFTLQFDRGKDGWIEQVFPNPEDSYDAVWHDKLAFFEIGNGDLLAIDLDPSKYEQIVYLSHDDGEGHGHVLASNFEALLSSWVPLFCTGGEDWQWLPFTSSKTSGIDENCPNASSWKRALLREDA
jgi:cell wall assembly regulator SMI1